MKKFGLFLMMALVAGLLGCSEEKTDSQPAPTPPTPPSILLEKVAEGMNELRFTATATHATTAAYVVLAEDAEIPAPEQILAEGELIDLRTEGAVELAATNLEPATSYKVVAAAKNEKTAVNSNTLYMTTTEQPQLMLTVEIVQVDHEKMHFRYTTMHADELFFLVMPAEREIPEATYVLTNGTAIPVDSRESVEVNELEPLKEYRLLVVAAGSNQTLMHDPLSFTTEDDPEKVIRHEYTRSKGSCLDSGSAFVQFSYEDANEADNFAYNAEWLGLDFRFEPGNEYLPAGTYKVTSDGANFTLLSRYSTYGYDDGIQLDSGEVKVSILDGAEKQYYKFEIDVMLQNGRHFVASYEGDVEGMPIKNTILVKTTFTQAEAAMTDSEGEFWTLTMRDDIGQEARFDLYNSYGMPYICRNSYTLSTSAEAENNDFEPGEFDGTTSTFTVVGPGEGTHKFVTGTLHVDIDWSGELYLMTFYGTLENDVVVEAEFLGAVEGISLAQSDKVYEVTFNEAVASSLDGGAYWTTYLKNKEGYEVKLVAECAASPDGLPAGEYTAGVGAGHLSLESTYITIPGQQLYYFTSATLTVTIDQQAKQYGFELVGQLEDGRTYKSLFTGEVEGMVVKEQEEVADDLVWESATAKKWYSDNWEINLADTTGEHAITFDMRVGNSDINYIPSGTYTEDQSSGKYIDTNYSKYNGAKVISAAVLEVAYDEVSHNYELSFAITLADGREITGKYSGLVAGSPAE